MPKQITIACWMLCRRVLIPETGPVTERLRVREIDDDEGRRLVRIVRRGSGSLYPRYRGGRPPKFTLPQRREIKKIAKSQPGEPDLPFSA
jgi:hypothetical protein